MKNLYKILIAKPEENRSLGRSNRGWVDNIVTNMGYMANNCGF
jgi:hypothetical protein